MKRHEEVLLGIIGPLQSPQLSSKEANENNTHVSSKTSSKHHHHQEQSIFDSKENVKPALSWPQKYQDNEKESQQQDIPFVIAPTTHRKRPAPWPRSKPPIPPYPHHQK